MVKKSTVQHNEDCLQSVKWKACSWPEAAGDEAADWQHSLFLLSGVLMTAWTWRWAEEPEALALRSRCLSSDWERRSASEGLPGDLLVIARWRLSPFLKTPLSDIQPHFYISGPWIWASASLKRWFKDTDSGLDFTWYRHTLKLKNHQHKGKQWLDAAHLTVALETVTMQQARESAGVSLFIILKGNWSSVVYIYLFT